MAGPLPVKKVLQPAVLSTDARVYSAAGRPPPWPWNATVVMPFKPESWHKNCPGTMSPLGKPFRTTVLAEPFAGTVV